MSHLEGKVIRARSGFFDVETPEGVIQCRMRGRLKKVRVSADIAVVGDDVLISVTEDGHGSLEEVRPRRSRFSRCAALYRRFFGAIAKVSDDGFG